MAVTTLTNGMTVKIDVKALRRAARDLKLSDPEASKALRLGLKAAAQVVALDAKKNSDWSTRIPGTIKASSSGAISAKVKAGGPNAPHAAALENNGKPGKFRHPVFGNDQVWVDQPARPYLGPAADKNQDVVAGLVLDTLKTAFSAMGLDIN